MNEPVLTVYIDGDKLVVKSDMLDFREFYLPDSTFKTIELFLMYVASDLGEALAKERPWRGGKP